MKPKIINMTPTKPKRPTSKMFIVSDDTHAKLKQYAIKKGYKLQYVADEAVSEYLKRQEPIE
jgi:predicted transcriptional regulator